MESFLKLCIDDINVLLPHMKARLMSGTENAQVSVVEQISMFLKKASTSNRGDIVRKLVKFDVMSTVCDVMQTSDENYIKVVLECFELISAHKGFYENHAAMEAIGSMLRLAYCINKSLKTSTLFEKLVQCICNILVRSTELTTDFDAVCVPQQIIFFLKSLDIRGLQKSKLKFTAITAFNVVLQLATFEENTDEEMIIDVCLDALGSMTDIVKYGDDDDTILSAANILCGTCAGGTRFCNGNYEQEDQIDDKCKTYQKKMDLSECIYNTMMTVIIPYVKNIDDLSRIDSIRFHRNLVSCLNNLYQIENCNHNNLSNHLTANGYLKYFLCLTVQLPKNLQRSICILLSRILSVLGKTAFSKDTTEFDDILRQGLIELPKDSVEQWNNAVTNHGKDGTALMILFYYHYHGTQENDTLSPRSLIARIMLMPQSQPISVLILKPLWFLFAVSYISHPYLNSMYHYEDAVIRLTNILQCSKISDFYTHHIDLLHYCLKCPDIPQSLVNQVLDLWLIESDGDIKPLLSFNCDKVVHRLLIVIQTGYPQHVISLATKGLRHLIQIDKDDRHLEQITDIVWHMLPNILTSYQLDNVVHIEAALELANITKPHVMPVHLIMRSVNSIISIILKKSTNTKFMTLIITQAHVLLAATISRNSFKVLEGYIRKPVLLKELYTYAFSKERSDLTVISIKLLTSIINCQKSSLIQCQKPLMIQIKNLVELLTYARKSAYSSMNEIQFIYELLTQNVNKSAVVLQKSTSDTNGMGMVINLYEMFHIIHVQSDPAQRDIVYQCLTAFLHFCNITINTLVPHLCTLMSNYDLVFNIVNMRYVSCRFVEFVTTWLHYRKIYCNDISWNVRSLYKTPFDESLDQLKEYSMILNNKEGLKDAHMNLQQVLLQFE